MHIEEQEKKKSVLTMARYACNRHHGWRKQAVWTNFRTACKCEANSVHACVHYNVEFDKSLLDE